MSNAAKILTDLYSDTSLRNNCSGYFKAVGKKLGVTLPDIQADPLIEQISSGSPGWVKIGSGLSAELRPPSLPAKAIWSLPC